MTASNPFNNNAVTSSTGIVDTFLPSMLKIKSPTAMSAPFGALPAVPNVPPAPAVPGDADGGALVLALALALVLVLVLLVLLVLVVLVVVLVPLKPCTRSPLSSPRSCTITPSFLPADGLMVVLKTGVGN